MKDTVLIFTIQCNTLNSSFLCHPSFVFSALTSLRQELDGLQHALSVDPRFVIFHLSVNDVDHTSSSAPDSSSSSVKSVHISLLQSNYAFVDILKDVVLLGEAKKNDSEWKWRCRRLSLVGRNNDCIASRCFTKDPIFLVNGNQSCF